MGILEKRMIGYLLQLLFHLFFIVLDGFLSNEGVIIGIGLDLSAIGGFNVPITKFYY